MDAHLENHLPLITARLVFAPRVLPRPPKITPRMTFAEIHHGEPREESPRPEPRRARTPVRRADTPGRITLRRKVGILKPTEAPSQKHNDVEFVSSASDEEMDDGDGSEDEGLGFDDDEGVNKNLIQKPKGDVSRPGRGGYNLYEALGWNQKTYDSVLLLVTRLGKERLDTTKSYRGQSKKKIGQVAELARKEFSFIKDYMNDWPVHDMLKTYLKNRSQTARNTKGKETAEKIDQIVNGTSAKSKGRVAE